MAKRRMPKANIDWTRLPACIQDRGTHYVALISGKRPAVVFWSSADARSAQADLARRAKTAVYCKAPKRRR